MISRFAAEAMGLDGYDLRVEERMSEVLRNLRHFIARDLVLVIAGSIVLAAFLYRFDRLRLQDLSLFSFLFLAGICYVIGYAVQAMASVVGIVTTAQLRVPGRLTRWLYRRLTLETWQDVPPDVIMAPIGSSIDEVSRARVERRVTLKQLSASAGPSSLIAAIILLWRYLALRDPFDGVAAIGACLIGVVLMAVGWVAAAQEAKFYQGATSRDRTPKVPEPAV